MNAKTKEMKMKAEIAYNHRLGIATRNDDISANARGMFLKGFPGLEPNTLYWDPTGSHTEGMGVNLVAGMKEDLAPAIKKFNDMLVDGRHDIEEIFAEYRAIQKKTLATTSWNIPVYAIRGTPIVSPGSLPLASLLARIAVDKNTIQSTPITTIGAAATILESDTGYSFNDDTYADGTLAEYLYTVKGYGRGNKISELMSLVGGAIENPRQSLTNSQLLAIRRFEELQIFQGTNSVATSFAGVYDWRSLTDFGYARAMAGAALTAPDDVRLAINTLVNVKGANRQTLIGATDNTTLTSIANDLQDYMKTADPYKNYVVLDTQNNINIEILCVVVDGVKIFPSYGAPTTPASHELIFLDLKDHYMAMVQDAILKPLAKTGPLEQFATDAYGCLVSEGKGHIGRISGIA